MGLAQRLVRRMEIAGLSQSALAKRVGLSQQAIGKLCRGEATSSAHLHKIARELGTTPAFLTGETDDPAEGAIPAPSPTVIAEQLDLVEVQEIDLKFGMGATELEVPVTRNVRHFSREWLRQYTRANPETLYFAQGIGDSMAPTLLDSDLLLIDTSEQSIRMADKIYAIAFYGSGMVKRLRPGREGIRILSDNPSVPEEVASDDELHVLGRVVGIVRKI
jgi:phage repressor protein C with HTH and peptisase S24 domain